MKRNKGVITVIGLLCGLIMLCTQPISAYANSAQTQWEGVDSTPNYMHLKESNLKISVGK